MTRLDLEGIVGDIEKMGYVTVELKDRLKPSFYKLGDGTVVRVLISINHLTSHTKSPHGYNISWSSAITCQKKTDILRDTRSLIRPACNPTYWTTICSTRHL